MTRRYKKESRRDVWWCWEGRNEGELEDVRYTCSYDTNILRSDWLSLFHWQRQELWHHGIAQWYPPSKRIERDTSKTSSLSQISLERETKVEVPLIPWISPHLHQLRRNVAEHANWLVYRPCEGKEEEGKQIHHTSPPTVSFTGPKRCLLAISFISSGQVAEVMRVWRLRFVFERILRVSRENDNKARRNGWRMNDEEMHLLHWFDESHWEHPISFVQYNERDVLKGKEIIVKQINNSSRSCNEDLGFFEDEIGNGER